MPWLNCIKCSAEFYAKPNAIAKGWAKYCSNTCAAEARKRGKFVSCYQCKKMAWKTPKDERVSRSGFLFCNKVCSMAWKNGTVFSGINHPLWKHGHSTYREKLEKHSKTIQCNTCGLQDKRILVAHHKDSNRKNNKIDNLMWLCRNCHYLIHNGKTV